MRCDQPMGLSDRARAIIAPVYRNYRDEIVRTYEDGKVVHLTEVGHEDLVKREPSGEVYFGMFENEYQLMKYTLPDGRVFVEFEQASPWSSGPCIFLALKDGNGNEVKESLWTDEEINSSL